MREQGTVIKEIGSGLVEVLLARSTACEKCGACHAAGANRMAIEARNEAGAKKGDLVEIEIPAQKVLQASFVIYLVPIAFMLAGYFIGSGLARSENVGIAAAFLFMGIGILTVRLYDRIFCRKHLCLASVIKILTVMI